MSRILYHYYMSSLPELDFSIDQTERDYYDRLEESDLFQGKMIMISDKYLRAKPGDIIREVLCLKCKDIQIINGIMMDANANCQKCGSNYMERIVEDDLSAEAVSDMLRVFIDRHKKDKKIGY